MEASTPRVSTRVTTAIPQAIAVAGAALVVYQWAVARPLWLDEEMIAINIRDRGFASLAGKLSLEQSAPYGWLVLERLSLLIFGSGERSLRLVPMLFGLSTIATAWWIGRRWLGWLSTSILVLMCSVGQWVSYSFVELKHYSADVCFALLLPALAAYALETDRVALWWIAVAVAQVLANGALFVTPLCAAALVVLVLQRRGSAAAVRAAWPGLVWAAVFAVNYALVLRPAQTSEFLQGYWQTQFPPTSSGAMAMVAWIGGKLAPFTVKPGGTRVGWLLWVAAVAGFAFTRERRRPLAIMFATVPLAGILLTTLHFVPFFERLVLWMVPAIYVGVALLVPGTWSGTWHVPGTYLARTWYVPGTCLALLIAADVAYLGVDDLKARPAPTNHRLDDRSTVRWLAAREQPGDVWLTTHLALPAIWWYAPDSAAPVLEIGYADPGPDCHPDDLPHALDGAVRALVFTGFHFDDQPPFFDDLLLDRMTAIGQMTAYRGFDDVSRAAIVDRRLTSRRERGDQVPGCLRARQARRW